ncbi:hypothetical protein BGW80DRAFT_1456645 [Lactifluus volemus]|nr:hypothetical protein BGW80DRAFT_1456645 [Lactifluus volemus]
MVLQPRSERRVYTKRHGEAWAEKQGEPDEFRGKGKDEISTPASITDTSLPESAKGADWERGPKTDVRGTDVPTSLAVGLQKRNICPHPLTDEERARALKGQWIDALGSSAASGGAADGDSRAWAVLIGIVISFFFSRATRFSSSVHPTSRSVGGGHVFETPENTVFSSFLLSVFRADIVVRWRMQMGLVVGFIHLGWTNRQSYVGRVEGFPSPDGVRILIGMQNLLDAYYFRFPSTGTTGTPRAPAAASGPGQCLFMVMARVCDSGWFVRVLGFRSG